MHGQTNKLLLKHRLQRMLRNNMTDAERKFWSLLYGRRMNGLKFRRQHPYEDYILDFACLEERLVIE